MGSVKPADSFDEVDTCGHLTGLTSSKNFVSSWQVKANTIGTNSHPQNIPDLRASSKEQGTKSIAATGCQTDQSKPSSQFYEQTKEIVNDILQYLNAKSEGKVYKLHRPASSIIAAIDEILVKHGVLFNSVKKGLKPDCSEDICKEFCIEALREMFMTKQYNWGRIVTVFAFTGYLANYFFINKKQRNYEVIKETAEEFICSELGWWIEEHGGWRGCETHFEEPPRLDSAVLKGLLLAVGLGAVITGTIASMR